MRDFIAVQQFIPKEQEGERKCIWCKQETPRNKAHIISRKLTLTSHANTVLKYSVCQNCNSKCSELEGWILRNSPLSWVRFFYYFNSNRNANTNAIPAYFYAEDQQEWLVYKLEGKRATKSIDSQLILTNQGQIRLITENESFEDVDRILSSIGEQQFVSDIRNTLPNDFSPRAILDKETIIVVARTDEELDKFVKAIQTSKIKQDATHQLQPVDSGRSRQHFKWSSENWLKFCAKIAYETLCLFEGARRCLEPEFETTRSYVLAGVSENYREMVFDENGPVSKKDVPRPLRVDLSIGQNCPDYLAALLLNAAPGMHAVSLYEIDGWVCSSISISGFSPSFLILGGPNVHLKDFYTLIYDEEANEFDCVRLAYDKSKPIIPLHIQGGMSEAIARTYKLRRQ